MKIIDSGMPDRDTWKRFFKHRIIFKKLEINHSIKDLVEIGFGYGTFIIPASRLISGNLYAFDIKGQFFENIQHQIQRLEISNIIPDKRDVIETGTGLPDNSIDYVVLFNILHGVEVSALLKEAFRILRPGGEVGIIHWKYDSKTPYGPNMNIRFNPAQLQILLRLHNFTVEKYDISLPPFHFGILAVKNVL